MWNSIGKVVTVTAGTPVRATSTQSTPSARLPCHAILFQQIPGNTGRIIIGKVGMNSTTYATCLAILGIPTTTSLPAANVGIPLSPNGFNLADYYIDSTVNGEGVLISYLEA